MVKIQTPIILLNFKTYSEAMGRKALKIARIAEQVSMETDVCICIAPQFLDIKQIACKVSIPVFAQHIDPVTFGRYTGFVLPESIKEAGATGSIISHSEKHLSPKTVHNTIKRSREIGLLSIVCCDNETTCKNYALMAPDMIVLEPPELIGTGISVSEAKPNVLKEAVKIVKKINPKITMLCGAGINSENDVISCMKLGAEGILVGSIVKEKQINEILSKLANAIKKV
jgi:triosephosphate isomerase